MPGSRSLAARGFVAWSLASVRVGRSSIVMAGAGDSAAGEEKEERRTPARAEEEEGCPAREPAPRVDSLAGFADLRIGRRAGRARVRREARLGGHGRLADARRGPRAQVVGRLEALLPGVQVHRAELADRRGLDEEVEGLALVEVRPARGGHVEQGAHRELPHRAVEQAQVLGDLLDLLDRALGALDELADALGPEAARLEVVHEILVDHEEVAREGLALEEVRELRLDALVAAGDRGDRGRRRDREQERVAETVLRDARLQLVPALDLRGRDAPQVELQLA